MLDVVTEVIRLHIDRGTPASKQRQGQDAGTKPKPQAPAAQRPTGPVQIISSEDEDDIVVEPDPGPPATAAAPEPPQQEGGGVKRRGCVLVLGSTDSQRLAVNRGLRAALGKNFPENEMPVEISAEVLASRRVELYTEDRCVFTHVQNTVQCSAVLALTSNLLFLHP